MPTESSLVPLKDIRDIVENQILGAVISASSMKNRGQELEAMISRALDMMFKSMMY